MTSARFERFYPMAIAVIAAGCATLVVFQCDVSGVSKALPAGTMTFGIVVAGFSATQRNMLLAMRGASVLRFMLRTGYHQDVLEYLMHCVYAALLVSGVSIVGFFLGNSSLGWELWLISIAFPGGLVALVLALVLRNEILMVRIVKRFLEDPGSST